MEGDIISQRTLRYIRRSIIVERILRYRMTKSVIGRTSKQVRDHRKKKKTECGRPWADLHEDVLRVIKSKLCLSDQVNMSAVCKSWRLCDRPLMAMAYFSDPWSFTNLQDSWNVSEGRDVTFACEIYDSYGEKIHEASYSILERGWPAFFYRLPKVCASKEGWLLVIDDAHTAGTVTLCNPFSNLVVPVPRLGHQIDVATFSTIPTCSDCIIFVFYRNWGKTHLGFYRLGDRDWTKIIIAEKTSAAEVLSTAYIEGVLYYVFVDGMLGSFSYFEKYCSILTESFPKGLANCSSASPFDNFHLVECEGQVLLATADEKLDWFIFTYDESQMVWISGIRLGKRALFAGAASFLVPAVGDQVDLADCICYFGNEIGDLKVYSLKNKQMKDPPYEIPTCCHSLDLKHDHTIWIQPPNI